MKNESHLNLKENENENENKEEGIINNFINYNNNSKNIQSERILLNKQSNVNKENNTQNIQNFNIDNTLYQKNQNQNLENLENNEKEEKKNFYDLYYDALRFKKIHAEPMDLKLKELFLFIFGLKKYKKKVDTFNIAKLNFYESFNLLSYFRKINEIDYLKYLILDRDNLEIFNFASRKVISNVPNLAFKEGDYYNFFENDKNKDFINKDKKFFENLKISFDSILTKDNKSFDKIIDRNLDLLNFQLAEFKCFNI